MKWRFSLESIPIDEEFWLPIQVKDKLMSSISRKENGELIFHEMSLIEAHFFVPKSERVVINFIVSHLARLCLLFFNIIYRNSL